MQKCLSAFKEINEELNFVLPLDIKNKILQLIKDTERTESSINTDGVSPRTLVFLLITNVLDEVLSSGQYHVYRGTLSGLGVSLKKVFTYSNSKMVSLGFQTEADAKEDNKQLDDKIKDRG